ncbi:hypothetical protein BT69DRAFT_354738 [Atractiella rhizophila]|nr:hypothetical protein BT69DRAFT_354738 [Atractiella rhizophila]
MRNLEAETIPFLARQATSRLRSLLLVAVAGHVHRETSHHLASQPIRPAKRKRPDDEEEFYPMWEEEVLQDPGKVLDALDQLENEEEKKSRIERMDRDAKESTQQKSGTPSTPVPTGGGDGASAVKKKKEGPTLSARNTSEAVQKKMSDMTALRSVGLLGKTSKYSWLSGGQGAWADSAPKAGSTAAPAPNSTPGKQGLPPPRFASNLPPPRFQNTVQADAASGALTPTAPAPMPQKLPPAPHSLYGEPNTVVIEDILWGIEQERVPTFRSWPISFKKPGKTEVVSRWRWGVGR